MARSRNVERLYIGTGGHIACIDVSSGDEVWRTKLKGRNWVTVWQQAGRVFGGVNGELFCLDANSGEIVWHNKLPGLGLGIVTFGSSQEPAAMAAAVAAAAAASAAS